MRAGERIKLLAVLAHASTRGSSEDTKRVPLAPARSLRGAAADVGRA
jgi:hypothetical protein